MTTATSHVTSSSRTSFHVSDVARTSKSLLMSSFVTPTTDSTSGVSTAGLGNIVTTSTSVAAGSSLAAALTSTPRTTTSTTTTTITSTGASLEPGRDANSTTDTSTDVPLFSTVVSPTTASSPPVRITTTARTRAPTTTGSDGSTYFTVSPTGRTSFVDPQTNYSQQVPVTRSEVTGNRTSAVTTSPLSYVTTSPSPSTTLTSLPPYTGNTTQSLGFSDKQLANVTSQMTSRAADTSQTGMAVNGSIVEHVSSTPLRITTATTSLVVDGTSVHALQPHVSNVC